MRASVWENQERAIIRTLLAYGKKHPKAALSFRFRPWVGETVKVNAIKAKE